MNSIRKELGSVKRIIRRGVLLLVFGARYISLNALFTGKSNHPFDDTNRKNVYWLGSFPPWQRNIGDQAQTYATNLFLHKYFSDFNVVRMDRHNLTRENLEKIRGAAGGEDFILVSSNGDFGDVYAENANAISHVRRGISETIPDIKKIYLSSTVYYKTMSPLNRWIQKDLSLFSDRSNVILCRESESLKNLKSIGLAGTVFPDIVFFLKPEPFVKRNCKSKRALIILRGINRESSLSLSDHDAIVNITRESGFSSYSKDIHHAKSPLYDFMYKKYFARLHETYQEFGLVITDRMHSMIFAALNGVPCVAIANDIPHKISAYREWLWRNTVFIDTVDDLSSAIRKACELNPEPIDLIPEFDRFRERYVD